MQRSFVSVGCFVAAAGVAVSCAGAPERTGSGTPSPTSVIPPASEVYAEPVEYAYRTPSAEAGEAYFRVIGVGDPYGAGIPYPVFLALQSQYPEELGRDWREFADRFGVHLDPARAGDPTALPVGFHLAKDPETRVDFLMVNCQLCHAEVLEVDGAPTVVSGLGNKTLRLHAYDAALVRIAQAPDFDARSLLAATRQAAKAHDLAWPPDTREPIVAEVLKKMKHRARVRGADAERLAAGPPGRIATIEGFALAMNEMYGTDVALGEDIGWAKIPDVAPWRYRETNSFDGVSFGAPVAMVAGADFAFGVRPQWYLQHPHIATSMYLYLRHFTRDLDYPGEIDEALAARGEAAFEQHCATCHGSYPGGRVAYTEEVVAHAVVGTDRTRLDAVTDAFIRASEAVTETRGYVVTAKSTGYVPRPLVDVWARGLYGHAGQWPDLATLALPPEDRPQQIVVDPSAPLNLDRLGVTWRPPGPTPRGREYLQDASVPGLGNGGHPFLSDLEAEERAAVLEYLKTL